MSSQRRTSAVAVADPPAVTEGTFAHHGAPASDLVAWFTDGLARVMSAAGYEARAEPGPDVQVVLHVVDLARPRPYRRKSVPTFVVAVAEVDQPPEDLLRTGYPVLVRGLANLAVLGAAPDPNVSRTSSPSNRAPIPSGGPGATTHFSPRCSTGSSRWRHPGS